MLADVPFVWQGKLAAAAGGAPRRRQFKLSVMVKRLVYGPAIPQPLCL
jgi:hypothetical protein